MMNADPTRSQTAIDPFKPAEMAVLIEAGGVAKVALDTGKTLALAILAGAFIALGALFSTVAATHTQLGYGPTRLLAGASFSLGLVLVLVGGAELFTGNNLIAMAWAGGRVTTRAMLRNWVWVYLGNFLGAALTALGVYLARVHTLGGGQVEQVALSIARTKVSLGWEEAFFRGVFCNALVCLAVWMANSARSTTDKVLCIVLPITAFVAAGFEHSIANMYFIPMGMLLEGGAGQITWTGFLWHNLLPVTIGNVVGGSLMVGFTYWFIYLRKSRHASQPPNRLRWRRGNRVRPPQKPGPDAPR